MATWKGRLQPNPGALNPEQREQLRNFKVQTRIANEKYLRTHKEVELLIGGFFSDTRMNQNQLFIHAGYFTQSFLQEKRKGEEMTKS
ncbi:RIIa domain-containing protein 1 isoform X2 [Microcebus murinus]|uniref:RIIa domain-containing protein 1 isoform X2 n=1 Tax=Microcebus murinus TaxID=30608 RepID=UPI003F6C5AC0